MKYDVDWIYKEDDINNIINNNIYYDVIITEFYNTFYINGGLKKKTIFFLYQYL
jgi:hypothetical protein